MELKSIGKFEQRAIIDCFDFNSGFNEGGRLNDNLHNFEFDELLVMLRACRYFISNYGRPETGLFRELFATPCRSGQKPGFLDSRGARNRVFPLNYSLRLVEIAKNPVSLRL